MVDRCICLTVPFAEMLELRAKGMDFEAIRRETGCCSGCGMCEPYVRLALATGEPTLPVLRGRALQRAWEIDPDAGRASRGDGGA